MEYGELINKSFKTVWDHKIIWLFGILLSLVSGFGGQGFNYKGDVGQTKSFNLDIRHFIQRLGESDIVLLVIAIILLATIVALVFIFLSFLFRGSLIHLVGAVDRSEEISARGGFSAGLRKVLPLLGKSLALGLPLTFGVLLLIGFDVLLFVLAWSHGTPAIGVIIALVLFSILLLLLIIAVAVAVTLVDRVADRFIVIDAVRIIDSLRRSYALLRKHPWQFFIAWLIMVGLGIAFGTVFGILALIIGVSAIGMASINIWLIIPVAVPGMILLLIPSGFFQAFSSTFWTYFFLALPGLDTGVSGQQEQGLPIEPGPATT